MNHKISSRLFFSILLAALCTAAWAQQSGSSQPGLGKRQLELLDLLNQSTSKTGRINSLLALSEYFWTKGRNIDSVASYAEKARSESKQLKFDSGYNEACYKLCRQHLFRRHYIQAWAIYDQVSRDQQARLLIIIGENFLFRRALLKKDLDTAYRYFSQALQISLRIHSDKWRHESLIALGKYYFAIKETETAKKCFLEIIADFQHSKDSAAEAHIWSELGKYWPDKDTAIHYQLFAHGNALRIYQALKDTGNMYSELEDISDLYYYHSNFEAAKTGYQHSLRLRIQTGKAPVEDYRSLSWIEYSMGNLDEALTNILASDKYVKAHQESWPDNYEEVMLGLIYADIGQHEKSLQYFLAADKINVTWKFYTCRKVVEQFLCLNQPEKALVYINAFEKDIPDKGAADRQIIAASKGDIYAAMKKNALAEKYFREMIQLDPDALKDEGRDVGFSNTPIAGSEAHYKIAHFYTTQNNYNTANYYLERALKINSFPENQYYSANLMQKLWWLKFKVDSTLGNHSSAIESYEKYTAIKDSIFNTNKFKQLQQLQVRYETDKKEIELKAKDQRIESLTQTDVLRLANLRQANFIRNITVGASLVLLLLGGLLYRQFKQKQRANLLVTMKNIQLQHLVKEKEWLLKEVHHRVKNNLHTIICLLESQAVYLKDDALKAVENSQHRVYAMSLIHQKLYQTDDVKSIEMSDYLPEFIHYLKNSFGNSRNIVYELDIDPLKLDIAKAIPIALIINEGITNAFKYAFPGNRRGLIKITLHKRGDEVQLVIADNGIGIGSKINDESQHSLGMPLMQGLSEDINGHIRIENDHGTRISLSFNMNLITEGNNILNPLVKQEVLDEN